MVCPSEWRIFITGDYGASVVAEFGWVRLKRFLHRERRNFVSSFEIRELGEEARKVRVFAAVDANYVG